MLKLWRPCIHRSRESTTITKPSHHPRKCGYCKSKHRASKNLIRYKSINTYVTPRMLNVSHGFVHFHQVGSKYDGIGTITSCTCVQVPCVSSWRIRHSSSLAWLIREQQIKPEEAGVLWALATVLFQQVDALMVARIQFDSRPRNIFKTSYNWKEIEASPEEQKNSEYTKLKIMVLPRLCIWT